MQNEMFGFGGVWRGLFGLTFRDAILFGPTSPESHPPVPRLVWNSGEVGRWDQKKKKEEEKGGRKREGEGERRETRHGRWVR